MHCDMFVLSSNFVRRSGVQKKRGIEVMIGEATRGENRGREKKRAQKREREKNEKRRAEKSEDGKLNI